MPLPPPSTPRPPPKPPRSKARFFDAPNYVVVRKNLNAGGEMKRHNHLGHSVLLTMTKGRADFVLNDGEKHELKQGDVMRFSGSDFISGKAREDSGFVVTLVREDDAPNGHDHGHEHEHAHSH